MLTYICYRCNFTIGSIPIDLCSKYQLGFHLLSEKEKKRMLVFHHHNQITVKSICDDCYQALVKQPELSILTTHIQ